MDYFLNFSEHTNVTPNAQKFNMGCDLWCDIYGTVKTDILNKWVVRILYFFPGQGSEPNGNLHLARVSSQSSRVPSKFLSKLVWVVDLPVHQLRPGLQPPTRRNRMPSRNQSARKRKTFWRFFALEVWVILFQTNDWWRSLLDITILSLPCTAIV